MTAKNPDKRQELDLDWFKERLAAAERFADSGVENWFGMGDVRRLVDEIERLRKPE